MPDTEAEDTKRKHVLELTTEVEPAKTFTVDGEEHKLYGLGHLSKVDEAKTMGAFSRYESLQLRMGSAQSDEQAERFAKKLQTLRSDVLCLLTTLDPETVDKLPLGAQTRLVSALQEEILDSGGIDDVDSIE